MRPDPGDRELTRRLFEFEKIRQDEFPTLAGLKPDGRTNLYMIRTRSPKTGRFRVNDFRYRLLHEPHGLPVRNLVIFEKLSPQMLPGQ